MFTIAKIYWHWFGRNRHAVLFYVGSEFVLALPISRTKADLLVAAGWSHGT